MILGALVLVVAGLALVPSIMRSVVAFAASTTTSVAVSQPPAPAQVPRPGPVASPTAHVDLTQNVWLWQSTEYSDDTTIVAADPNKYTIKFQADGRLAIRADCNQGSSPYTLEGPRLTIMPGVMTAAACVPPSQDATFLRDLHAVATYVMDGQNLVLNMKVDSGNMIFSPRPSHSFIGQVWHVQSYNNGRGGVVATLPDVELTATFADDGTVSGNTGCNQYRGPYSVEGDRITVGNVVTTRRACLSEHLNQQEQAFLTALSASTTYELTGDRLWLRNDAGATQLTLVLPSVQPAPSPAPRSP
jgi:heat shock protein HslJ